MSCLFIIRYYKFALEFETYYPQPPQKPKWVHAFVEEIAKKRLKQLPMTDTQIKDSFKKFCGYKRAMKYMVRTWYIVLLNKNAVPWKI